MTQAIWNKAVIAESDETIVVEGNHYFPPNSLKMEFFEKSDTHTTCHWKGIASYYNIEVKGLKNIDAAWYYPNISEKAKQIEGYVAFWKGVEIKQ